MDTVYGTAIAYAAPLFLLAIAIEVVVDRRRRTRYYSLADAITSVGCGTAFIGARISFGFMGLLVYDVVAKSMAPVQLSASNWLTWVFAFVLYDFCYYWWHRLSHTVSILWAAHVVHHQSEEFNLTTALRQPATGFLTAWVFYLPLALCGVPMSVYLTVGITQLLYQFWPHTRHIGRLGFLDRWIQTPSNHRVHHARNDVYLNKNYVGVFLIWDRLFGTFEEERDALPCEYGITEVIRTSNPAWANLHVYYTLARASWYTRDWRDKLRVWFAPPGWLPGDVPPIEDRPGPPAAHRNTGLITYALVQFAAILITNQHFLTIFSKQTAFGKASYFAVIFYSLVMVGIVLDGRRELFSFEVGRLFLCGVLVIVSGRWLGGLDSPALLAAILVFVAVSTVWFGVLWSRTLARDVAPQPATR